LTGVHFEEEGGSLRLVATDSYRLAVRDLHGVTAQEGLVPVRALRELAKSIGSPKIEVTIGDRSASFTSDRGTLDVRLIEGTFPNYRQLLPEAHQGRLTVDKSALLDAVGRASLVAEDHIPLRFTMGPGGLDLAVQRQEVGGESEHVDGTYEGDEMTIAFNPRYLSDGINAITDDMLHIDVIDALKPGLLRGASSDDFLYLLMPVRL
jgi:DNA polymerase-3 subunit beta